MHIFVLANPCFEEYVLLGNHILVEAKGGLFLEVTLLELQRQRLMKGELVLAKRIAI